MKLKSLIAIICSVCCLMATAQVRVENRYDDTSSAQKMKKSNAMTLKYGVKAGVNLSNMTSDMSFDPNFSMGTGFRAGVFANFHWGQRTVTSRQGTGLFGVQPEVIFSSQAIKSDAGNVKLTMIEVPVMAKLYATPALSIELGPQFSYLLSATPDDAKFTEASVKLSDCKGLMMGASAGLSYELQMGLVVGARYTLGFTEMAKNLKWKNSNIEVTLGWMF